MVYPVSLYSPLFAPDTRCGRYETLIFIRRFEEAVADAYGQQKMRCPVHLSIGQEACAVGVCGSLRSYDTVFSGHRAHAHFLAKGGNPVSLLAEFFGCEAGCSTGWGGSMHLTDIASGFVASTPIVGSSIPIAAGAAFASNFRSDDAVTTVFFGDGATESGVFYETLNLACTLRLPLLFVCEDNEASVYSPKSVRQSLRRNLRHIVEGVGASFTECDGNNVEEVYSISSELVADIRSRKVPALIYMQTFRHLEHCGPNNDDFLGYRPKEQIDYWRNRDPLTVSRPYDLEQRDVQEIESSIQNYLSCIFELVEGLPLAEFSGEEILRLKRSQRGRYVQS